MEKLMMGYKGCHLNDQVIVKKFQGSGCSSVFRAGACQSENWDFLHLLFLTFPHKVDSP